MFIAFGSRILDTKTRVWYSCATRAEALRRARELNRC